MGPARASRRKNRALNPSVEKIGAQRFRTPEMSCNARKALYGRKEGARSVLVNPQYESTSFNACGVLEVRNALWALERLCADAERAPDLYLRILNTRALVLVRAVLYTPKMPCERPRSPATL